MSRFTGPADLRHMGAGRWRSWQVLRPIVYEIGAEGSGVEAMVPVDFETDGASVPRLLWPLLPPTGRYLRAAILHDYLYTRIKAGEPHALIRTRAAADREFRRAMAACGVSAPTRWLMWAGVRLGGWMYFRK